MPIQPHPFSEIWRGEFLESVHLGHGVVCDGSGHIVEAWGDPEFTILPRSSCKMIQALPLIESGAANANSLGARHLALACASHQGAAIHTELVSQWLNHLELDESHLRCGAHPPSDKDAKFALIRENAKPCQIHNNCSGKHTGFLTVSKHLNMGPEYVEPDHPLQGMIKDAFENVTGQNSPGFAIDGCSAPNFATTVHGLAQAMAFFANASDTGSTRERAAHTLVQAMMTYPELVAGEGRACTDLMRAADQQAVVKTGAEGVYVGILPQLNLGIALKISDGATRAAECAIAAILVKLGILDRNDPMVKKWMNAPIRNWRKMETGRIQPAPGIL